ncbi:hypothetical protein A3709_07175 [Halioglobus sp. HI00S01]|uniref:hypothetical protein n=1 Tax=Halioglobus sp. HI00S01 TaxID=1822214 RepID=UPI0007C3653C|nr:hypothetical protein [Halioglobus sp. HI00S01]KZX56160.1 hypothetical protein A3709_07175 [Halioglobus sp. HI00S01]
MRLLGMLLALGAIGWVLYSGSGGGDSDTMIPTGYQQSLEKAESVEDTLRAGTEDKLKALENDG